MKWTLPLLGFPLGVCILLALLSPGAAAFEADASMESAQNGLTLAAFLAALAEKNPELRRDAALIQAARQRPAQAQVIDDPTLSAELWQVPQSGERLPLMLTLRQSLPWPGKLSARAGVMAPETKLAQAAERRTAKNLRLLGIRGYYSYRLATRSMEILAQDRQILDTVVASVNSRYQVGRAELAELLEARDELLNLDTRLLDLQRARDAAITTLNVLLAQPADEPLGTPVTQPEIRAVPPLSELLQTALRERPELLEKSAAIAVARAKLDLARVERAPDLALWGSYMATLRGVMDNTFTVGFQLSIPSFSLHRTSAAEKEARALLQAAQADEKKLQVEIAGEVREAYLHLDTAQRHIALHKSSLIPLAEQAVAASKTSYQTGRINLVVLLKATRMLVDHHLEYERFLADYGERLAELAATVGGEVL